MRCEDLRGASLAQKPLQITWRFDRLVRRMAAILKIGNVFYRTLDMDAAVHFYTQVLGFGLKLRDGDRWAAFDVGGSTLAVEGGAAGGPAVSTRTLVPASGSQAGYRASNSMERCCGHAGGRGFNKSSS